MAKAKKQPAKKKPKPGPGRRKFSTPEQARAQLEGVTAAQNRYRFAKRRRIKDKNNAAAKETNDIIVDSREKSERAWNNALRSVRRPEDLDGFD